MKKKMKNMSIIDKGVTVNGNISAKGNLIVKGIIKGTLTGEDVSIAKEGEIYAEADLKNLIVGGTFNGTARISNNLTILSSGKFSGRVTHKNLIVESGGILEGNLISIDNKAATVEEKELTKGKGLEVVTVSTAVASGK